MNASSPVKIRTNEKHFIYLFAISITLVIWQYYGMSIHLDVLPDKESAHPVAATTYGDSINGGLSIGRLKNTTAGIQLDCTIIRSETFAFCGVEFPLVDAGEKGIDVRRYSTLEIELEYHSEEKDTLLVYLINEEPADDSETLEKANLWAVSPVSGFNRFLLEPERFILPSWWIYQNSGRTGNLEPDISNVTALRITSGDNTAARDIRVIVQQIRFTGKLISADDLYLGLLASWLALFSFHGLRTIRAIRMHFRQSRLQNEQLVNLNRFLSIQKDQYETMAKKDELTGAWNRAGIRDLLETVLEDYRTNAIPCALIAIDIDDFKILNDTLGHAAGDEVLVEFTKLINAHTRTKDCLARWGGDEFLLICPDTDLHSAGNLAENLRAITEAHEPTTRRKITCSFGLAELTDAGIEDWFKRADDALYQAKRSGRNRVQPA